MTTENRDSGQGTLHPNRGLGSPKCCTVPTGDFSIGEKHGCVAIAWPGNSLCLPFHLEQYLWLSEACEASSLTKRPRVKKCIPSSLSVHLPPLAPAPCRRCNPALRGSLSWIPVPIRFWSLSPQMTHDERNCQFPMCLIFCKINERLEGEAGK